ncbi:hypothetical protein ACIQTZ_22020 [Paenarthrobacter sp. NPDC090520]|uniref:hypothetical protein n=1 Tax=unclassified Paenarthrobacter TaxID=2634190 RepID=UPI00380982B9
MNGTSELSHRIRAAHGPALDELMRELSFCAPGPTGIHIDRRLGRIGPVPSVTHTGTYLTVVADLEDLYRFSSSREVTGCCVTIGMAGHRRQTGTLTTLVPKECEAWVEAILGHQWMAHVYRVEPHRKGMYYRVFLDDTQSPVSKPAQVPDDSVELLHSHHLRSL